MLDSFGNPIPTYDTDDVIDMARAWTGFVGQPVRGNIEGRMFMRYLFFLLGPYPRMVWPIFSHSNVSLNPCPAWKNEGNFVDPMELVAERRDHFPKKSIRGGYIGDRLPLCSDLPEKPWTRKGATWHLLGNDPKPHMEEEDPKW